MKVGWYRLAFLKSVWPKDGLVRNSSRTTPIRILVHTMTVAATMTESLTEEEKALLGNVPETGSSIGNVSLIRALK
jgi:hypothetical protein